MILMKCLPFFFSLFPLIAWALGKREEKKKNTVFPRGGAQATRDLLDGRETPCS
jgi:hypothetical protein